VRSSDIRRELGVEPLLLRVERSQLRWFGHLIRMPPGRLPFSGHIQLGGDPRADPAPAGGITYLVWPGNASGSPRRNWSVWLGRRKPGGPCLASCHCDPAPDKRTRMDGWIYPTSNDYPSRQCVWFLPHNVLTNTQRSREV